MLRVLLLFFCKRFPGKEQAEPLAFILPNDWRNVQQREFSIKAMGDKNRFLIEAIECSKQSLRQNYPGKATASNGATEKQKVPKPATYKINI